MADTSRQRALNAWAQWVCRHPRWVLGVALTVAAASVVFTALNLEFEPDRNALISPDLEWNKRFEDWRDSFPGSQDMYVVVDMGQVDFGASKEGLEKAVDRRRLAMKMADELAAKLQVNPDVEHVTWRYPVDQFGPRTIRLRPMDQFHERLEQMGDARFLLQSPTPQHLLLSVQNQITAAGNPSSPARKQLESQGMDSAVHTIDIFALFLESVEKTLKDPPGKRVSLGQMLEEDDSSPWQYMESGRMLFLRVTPKLHRDQLNMFASAIDACRRIVADVKKNYPQLDAGLTGIDVIESDETEVAVRDATIASVVAVILISILLVLAFHSLRTPLLTMIALMIGVAWSFGFVTLSIGYLQVISVIFTAILLGLGIDFGIHIASSFEITRHEHEDGPEGATAAICQAMRTVGPGVLTGAVTTAIAFGTTLFTDFKGVSEMGLIAGAGVLLCLLSMFSVFPALLRLFNKHHKNVARVEDRKFQLFKEQWVMPFVRRPVATLVIAGLLSALSLVGALRIGFDYDLLKLFPEGTDSFRWYRRVVDHGDQSIWTAISVADNLEEARKRKQALQKECGDLIARYDGIALLFPDDDDLKIERIKAVAGQFKGILADDAGKNLPAAPDLASQLRTLGFMIALVPLPADAPTELRPKIQRVSNAIASLLKTHDGLEAQTRVERLAILQTEYASFQRDIRRRLTRIFDTSPLTPADVPEEFLRPFVAKEGPLKGKVALEIYPKVPPAFWESGALDPRFLPGFVNRLDQVDSEGNDPHLTGVMVQIYRSGALIEESYRWVGVYALIVVFLLVWLDFRNLHDAILCLVPVGAGFAITFGIMNLLGMSINPANIIVLPLMFGIGVDAGVHVIHRYRQAPLQQPPGLSHGTGKGITLTSVTTMIGFGSMLFTEHRGIASLAFVMTVGIALTLLACWIIVPSWLELRNRWAARSKPAPEST